MSHFAIRPETFGATVYDRQSLSYFFVGASQFATLCSLSPDAQNASILVSSMTDKETDISGGNFERLLTELNRGGTLRLRTSPKPLPTDSLAAPIRIYLETCLRCNGHCRYCLNNAGTQRPSELSTEELQCIIENLGRDGIFEVRLTGGEPTLHPGFFDLAHTVQKNDMALSVNSNLLINGTMLDRLIQLHPDLLITSLDATEEAHSRQRGKGYQGIVENVHHLRRANIPVRLNCTLSRDTLIHIERFIDEFAPLGCGFSFILIRPVGRAKDEFNPPPLSDMIPVIQMIESKRQEYRDSYSSTSFQIVLDRELTIGRINLTGCNAIQKSLNINSDGTVLPCAFLYELSPAEFALGNVRDDNYSVLRIWRESEMLRRLRQQSSDCNIKCIHCPHFRQDCLGTCIFMELYSTLTKNPDPYCKVSMELFQQQVNP